MLAMTKRATTNGVARLALDNTRAGIAGMITGGHANPSRRKRVMLAVFSTNTLAAPRRPLAAPHKKPTKYQNGSAIRETMRRRIMTAKKPPNASLAISRNLALVKPPPGGAE